MIENYDFGTIMISGKEYTSDVICFQGKVTSWWRETSHNVSRNDIVDLVHKKPAVIVIGTGAYGGMRVPQEIRDCIDKQNIELIIKQTDDAMYSFNTLEKQGKDVAIAMHLTC